MLYNMILNQDLDISPKMNHTTHHFNPNNYKGFLVNV